MLEARYRWRIPTEVVLPPDVMAAAAEAGLPGVAAEILARRGLAGAADIRSYAALDPRTELHDPRLLPDAEAAAERLRRARDAAEPVLVVGDFDADGLTGLAILTRALRACGLVVGTHVPDRLEEGHGLSLRALDAAAAAAAGLIVTVDTGSTSLAEVADARRRGIDVIVTDHHHVGPELPAAVAVVNPQRPDSVYPDRRLAGSGVALKVAQLVSAELLGIDERLAGARLADLATIGTVADVAPIVGENRAIARLGLERLRRDPRPGIAALLARAGIGAAGLTLETVGFAIAPRLNAAGRVGEARDAADLLLTQEEAEATRLAEALETANATRRDWLKGALEEARAAVAVLPDGPLVMVAGDWPIGIIGLVAGRLADEHARPAVVGARVGDHVRASARGDGSIDLAAALDACGDLLERHGGHHDAAGFEIQASRWDALVERLLSLAAATARADRTPALEIDLALPAAAVDHRLLGALSVLEPTGPGNPAALLAIHGLTVTRVRAVNGGHAQLTLRRDVDVLDAIAFGRSDVADVVAVDERVDVVARLGARTFAGVETMQLEIVDIASTDGNPASGPLVEAIAARPTAVRPTVANPGVGASP
jgi:single-stranded-DNA-specific exonuclease